MLNSGEVFTVGGATSQGCIPDAELYNPATGTFSATGSPSVCRKSGLTVSLVGNGNVLVAGGMASSGLTASSSELYNPTTGTFSTTGSLNTARFYHTATLLPSGQVLIVGGLGSSAPSSALSSAELYNPTTGTFSFTGNLNAARGYHTATLLPNGEVLIAGGVNSAGAVLSSAELYNPATGAFSYTGSLNTARYFNTATLLGGGQVLIAGGVSNSNTVLSSAEVYSLTSGAFVYTGSMTTAVWAQTATAMNDGTVLIAAGNTSVTCCGQTSAADIYSPVSQTFSATAHLTYSRAVPTATLLTNGQVLVAYGMESTSRSGAPVIPGELYKPGAVLGYVDPKFVVVGVTYAPPGPSSNTWVSYSNSTTLGTTNSLSQSFMTGDTYSTSISKGFNIPMVASGQITNQFATGASQVTNNSSTVSMAFQTSTAEKTAGTVSYWAPVDNDSDIIWVWLNPAVILTVSNGAVTWNGYGVDKTDQPGMDIVPIPLGYLNGHFGTMPPDIQTSLNRTWAANQIWPSGQGPALTSADLAQIASADPFSVSSYGPTYIGLNPPSPETPDSRFTMSTCTSQASFNYLQAAPSTTPAIYSCTLSYTNNSTRAKGIATTSSQTFSLDASFKGSGFFSEFSLDAKSTSTLTWTIGEQSSISNSTTSTGSLSIQGPPCNNQVQGQGPCIPVYDSGGNEPTQFYVYEDNMFGTFMFAPVHYY